MQKETFKIYDMDCAEECNLLKTALKGHEGIRSLDFDILNRHMSVTYDGTKTDSEKILGLIHSTGLKADLSTKKELELNFWHQWGRLILCILSGVSLASGFILHLQGPDLFGDFAGLKPIYDFPPLFVALFYLVAILSGGWYVAPKSFASLRHFRPDMNVLMLIAVIGATAIGQLFEGATVTFLFSVALLLESWSVDKARKAISALLDLSPKLARVKVDGTLVERKVEDIVVGETVFVRPGEKIPLDGVVLSGSSSVNQAPITGESMPVYKNPKDQVFAGTINEEGALEIEVTKGANDTTLSRIIQMVQEAKGRRAPSEQWVNHFSVIYTPCMLILALCVAIIPPLFMYNPLWTGWIYRGLVLLVIACPCALVISTPVSIVSALTAAARFGVLIKGGVYLELAGKLEAVAFDKTGTITEGKPRVQTIIPLNHHTEEDLLKIAAQLEMSSEHPLARAILEKAKQENISVHPAQDFQIFKGLGAEATIQGQRFWIGSHRFMHEQNRKESPEAHEAALKLEDAGHSVVAIGDFTHICGLISIADNPRLHIRETLQSLRDLGVKKLVMLTGDNKKTAETLAALAGIEDVYAELLPENKVEVIEKIKQTHRIVAMVGDGVNDAPAMAASAFGIAMGAMGTDAAFETADIVLMTDDLSQLPWLVRHARRTLQIIKANIFFALAIKGLFITLALFGLATMWMAIGADTGASLLVVFNGLRLLKKKQWQLTES